MTIISLVKNLKTFVMISWRNMLRQKRRSLVVIASMAIGIFAMIISVGFLNGMTIQMVENTISTSLGHIAIHKKGYQDNMKLEYNFYPEQTYYERSPNYTIIHPKRKAADSCLIRRPMKYLSQDPWRTSWIYTWVISLFL
jgi:ABC-type lipoprotein release transport system permease subunit